MNPIIPTVSDYMTPAPQVVAPSDKLSRARQLMQDYGIRHLPVMDEGELVGVVSERDMRLVHSMSADAPDAVTVEDAMTTDPFSVAPEMPVNEVARRLAEKKIGSAVVVDHGEVSGVFTTTDALHALADALEGKEARRSYEGVATAAPSGRRRGEHDIR